MLIYNAIFVLCHSGKIINYCRFDIAGQTLAFTGCNAVQKGKEHTYELANDYVT